jgi:hypothetical protein
MTNNQYKLQRIKSIEDEQSGLINEINILFPSIDKEIKNENELVALDIYKEKTQVMKDLIFEKLKLLLDLGFKPQDGMIDMSLRETSLWKSIEEEQDSPTDIYNYRQSVCTNCPEFVTISGQCKVLGEFVSEYAMLENSSCPIGNW